MQKSGDFERVARAIFACSWVQHCHHQPHPGIPAIVQVVSLLGVLEHLKTTRGHPAHSASARDHERCGFLAAIVHPSPSAPLTAADETTWRA